MSCVLRKPLGRKFGQGHIVLVSAAPSADRLAVVQALQQVLRDGNRPVRTLSASLQYLPDSTVPVSVRFGRDPAVSDAAVRRRVLELARDFADAGAIVIVDDADPWNSMHKIAPQVLLTPSHATASRPAPRVTSVLLHVPLAAVPERIAASIQAQQPPQGAFGFCRRNKHTGNEAGDIWRALADYGVIYSGATQPGAATNGAGVKFHLPRKELYRAIEKAKGYDAQSPDADALGVVMGKYLSSTLGFDARVGTPSVWLVPRWGAYDHVVDVSSLSADQVARAILRHAEQQDADGRTSAVYSARSPAKAPGRCVSCGRLPTQIVRVVGPSHAPPCPSCLAQMHASLTGKAAEPAANRAPAAPQPPAARQAAPRGASSKRVLPAGRGSAGRLAYPSSRRVDQKDTYWGTDVEDPYRWLEDVDSPDTKEWVDSENAVTQAWLAESPYRPAIHNQLEKLMNYDRVSAPHRRAGRFLYSHNTGLQNQPVLMVLTSDAQRVTREDLRDATVLLDPNKFSDDGKASLSGYELSEDGKYLAYLISEGGSDWTTLRILDIDTREHLDDQLLLKFSGPAWMKDTSGFFYSGPSGDPPQSLQEALAAEKQAATNTNTRLFYHRLGTHQSEDVLIYELPEADREDWQIGAGVTDDGRYLIVSMHKGTDPNNKLYYIDLEASPLASNRSETWNLRPLFDKADASYSIAYTDADTWYIHTTHQAPRKRLVKINLSSPNDFIEVLPQNGASTMESVGVVGTPPVMFVEYLEDAKSVVDVHNLDGSLIKRLDLPEIGSAGGFGGYREDVETFYAFSSFNRPNTIYRLDLATLKSEVWQQPKIPFDPELFETKQEFATSKDGTKVPVFIAHKKGISLDGSNPALLYGYGGFDVPLGPFYSSTHAAWMDMGGVFALAILRGGGEYGKDWHEAATKMHKQNTFDDCFAAAEHLSSRGYCSPKTLAVHGASNGGLLAAAVAVQRPELFAAAMPEVGVLDLLRFHKFTVGWAWGTEYGTADDSKEMFEYLKNYSPYHYALTHPGREYPAMLISTADHDDRVIPLHSFKFAAAMQEAQGGEAPILIRVQTRAGHGAGKSTSQTIDEQTDVLAFLLRTLDMNPNVAWLTKSE